MKQICVLCCFLTVPAEVLSWMENVLAGAKNGNLGGSLSLYESQSYVIRANLNPSKVNEEK